VTRKEFLAELAQRGIEIRAWHVEHMIASGKITPMLNGSGWRVFTAEHVNAVVQLETAAAK
jgi:hypothetical protein